MFFLVHKITGISDEGRLTAENYRMTIFRPLTGDIAMRGCNFTANQMKEHPFIFSNKNRYRIGRHIVFWGLWWLFQGFLYSFIAAYDIENWWQRLAMSMLQSLIYLVAHVFLAYSLMYFVVPRFLLRQRYWMTTAWTILLFAATATISMLLGVFVIDRLREQLFDGVFSGRYRSNSNNIFLSLMAGLRGAITIGGIAAAIKLMKYWYIKEQRNMQLQQENIAAQIQLLKAQIHPHFLFNTLNNIYSFIQATSPQAAKMLTGMSDLLRFILYEGDKPLVSLEKELKMLRDYIELEKIRYGNELELFLDIPKQTNGLQIAPLLLLPLIENCFKHGTSNVVEQPWINLQIVLQGRHLHMKLLNGKSRQSNATLGNKGIGLKNVEKRLLLLYPGKHEFTIANEEEVFIVNLKLELEQSHIEEMISQQTPNLEHAG